MVEDWDSIVAGVSTPARPQLERCLSAYRRYQEALTEGFQQRTRTITDVEHRLNAARARVFAAGTGVVPAEVTALEREWLTAARAPGPTRELATLWQQVAPERWIEGGRSVPPSAEAIVTLASDPDGVEEAERAASALREALLPSGITVGPKTDWMVSREVMYIARADQLFSVPFASIGDVPHDALQRAHRLRNEVRARLGDRRIEARNSSLGREVGWLAFASSVWRELRTEPAPFEPFLAIYRHGYVPTAVDATGVTLTAIPVDLRR